MSSTNTLRLLPWVNVTHMRPQRLPRILYMTRTPSNIRRYASKAPSVPKTLAKPAKYVAPSHPYRPRKKTPTQYPGPPVSEKEKEQRKRKRYPNMFPNQGTFMHWFLTNRLIHLWITLGTLFSLALFTFITDFRRTTPFIDLVPPGNTFLSNPFSWISKFWEVYKLHIAHISAVTAEKRRKNVDDVARRDAYFKAHGRKEGLLGWAIQPEENALDPALRINGAEGGDAQNPVPEGRRRQPVKRWLGIWE